MMDFDLHEVKVHISTTTSEIAQPLRRWCRQGTLRLTPISMIHFSQLLATCTYTYILCYSIPVIQSLFYIPKTLSAKLACLGEWSGNVRTQTIALAQALAIASDAFHLACLRMHGENVVRQGRTTIESGTALGVPAAPSTPPLFRGKSHSIKESRWRKVLCYFKQTQCWEDPDCERRDNVIK